MLLYIFKEIIIEQGFFSSSYNTGGDVPRNTAAIGWKHMCQVLC